MNRFNVAYSGALVDLGVLFLPLGGWIEVNFTWLAADNSRLAADAISVPGTDIQAERLSDRLWRLHVPPRTHRRVLIQATFAEREHQVAQLTVRGR